MIIFRHEKSAAYATLKFQWWAGMDSNHRNPKMTDLQSVPFNHSGTYPYNFKSLTTRYIIYAYFIIVNNFFIYYASNVVYQ